MDRWKASTGPWKPFCPKCMVAENQRDWDCHIPKALFAYRTTFHESSGYSAFRVNFGCSPLLSNDIAVGGIADGTSVCGDLDVEQISPQDI